MYSCRINILHRLDAQFAAYYTVPSHRIDERADMGARTFEEITPEWLSAVLGEQGSLLAGKVTGVKQARSTSITAHNATLELGYSDDAEGTLPGKLFFKRNGRIAEAQFYRHVAPLMTDVGLLVCYDAGYDDTGSHLLLEYVDTTHFAPPDALPMSVTYCEMVMDLLADLHGQWWRRPELNGNIGAIAEDTPGFLFQQASQHFAQFVDYLGDRLSEKRRRYLERILSAFPRYRSSSPKTLVHGDAHWWNFLYPHDPRQNGLYLIDWAVWHVDFGVSDIAYTVALECYPEHRARIEKALVRRYHERLLTHDITDYAWERCWEDYRRAIIDHCLWPIFWQRWELPTTIWWFALECILSAFEDLHCEEFI
jgi:thiamine kinase-like enzyme